VYNKDPTRISSCSSVIDWVVGNNVCNNMLSNITTINVPCSDHNLIVFKYKKLRLSKIKKSFMAIYDYKNLNHVEMLNYLDNIDVNLINTFEKFVNFIQIGITQMVPQKRIQLKTDSCTFLSNEYFKVAKLRDDVYNSYKGNYNPNTFMYFKHLRKISNNIASRDKKDYFLRLINKTSNNGRHNMWKVFNKYFNADKNSAIKTIKINNKVIENLPDICNKFNHYFTTVIDCLLNTKSFASHCSSLSFSCLHTISQFNLMDIETVHKLIFSCKGSSVDNLQIPKKLVDWFSDYFAFYLTAFINKSFLDSEYPSIFKSAKEIPIIKKVTSQILATTGPFLLIVFQAKCLKKLFMTSYILISIKTHCLPKNSLVLLRAQIQNMLLFI